MNKNALAPYSQNIQHLWQVSATRASASINHQVFAFQQPVIQKALIDAEILNTLYQQDESLSDARIRELLNTLVEANNAVFAEEV